MSVRLSTVGQALLERAAPTRQNRSAALAGGAALLLAIAVADYLAGAQISLTALYLVPIVLVTWNVGRGTGLAAAIAGAVLTIAGDVAAGATYSSWLVPWTMLLLWAAMFISFVLVVAQLKRALEREQEMARVDALTGVANRRHFLEMAAMELSRARRNGRPLTVAYLDVDDFKQVNDQRGHAAGDALLRAVAAALRGRLRLTDSIGRMGGDEFAICLPETTAAAAERVLSDLRSQVGTSLGADVAPVTLSMGAVTYASPPASVDVLLRGADQALYAAKRGGKNRLSIERV
jgi:diguanylate cyclase (GGDEF)-like protein